MNCAACGDRFFRDTMFFCESCRMYRCVGCFPNHFECGGPLHKPTQQRSIARVGKLKKTEAATSELCWTCHREFLSADLLFLTELSPDGSSLLSWVCCRDCPPKPVKKYDHSNHT